MIVVTVWMCEVVMVVSDRDGDDIRTFEKNCI